MKKTVVLVLMLAAALILTGCGKSTHPAYVQEETAAVAAEQTEIPEPAEETVQTPEPTVPPTPEPTPEATPEPTSTPPPGDWCLEEMGIGDIDFWDNEKLQSGCIAYPHEEYYLDEIEIMYVQTDIAHVFSFTTPYYENYAQGYYSFKDEVKVIAECRGFSCCIRDDGLCGWVASDHLNTYVPNWM